MGINGSLQVSLSESYEVGDGQEAYVYDHGGLEELTGLERLNEPT